MRMAKAVLVCSIVVLALASSAIVLTEAACSNPLPHAVTPNGFCPFEWAQGLQGPRGMMRADNNDIIVVEQGAGQVTVLWDDDKNGVSNATERAVLARADGLNHAVVIHEGYLYASSATTVYRWPYKAGVRSDLGKGEVVVNSIPCCGHVSRTVVFDPKGRLYVQLGSSSNLDSNPDHAKILRWTFKQVPAGGFNWTTGELFALGVRNEVGLRFDKHGRLWGVENGMDNVFRKEFGGDIHMNNPSEEINLFDTERPGKFYGYPYCWSQFNLSVTGRPVGTQWGLEQFPSYSDSWCQTPSNVVTPRFNMPAHIAPLDILFYYKTTGSRFPTEYDGDAFVASHGSWNRDPPQGYRVLRIVFDDAGMPVSYEPFLYYAGPGQTGPDWPHRPVALAVGNCAQFGDCLFVTSDASNSILAVGYDA